MWHIDIIGQGVNMPDKIILALLAVSVFSHINAHAAIISDISFSRSKNIGERRKM